MPRDLPEAGKEKGVSGWNLERRRRGTAGKPEVKQIWGAKEMAAPIWARRSLPRKGMGLVGTTGKEWVRIGVSMQLSELWGELGLARLFLLTGVACERFFFIPLPWYTLKATVKTFACGVGRSFL